MKNFQVVIFLILVILVCSVWGEVQAQRSSYNKWDRIIFRNNPKFKQRLYNLTEVNMGYGARFLDQNYEIRRSGFSTLIGYRYNRAITLGVGAGLEIYNGGTLAPVYLEGQIYMNRFSESSIKPFLTGVGGYLYHVGGSSTDIKVFANPGAGFLIPVTYHTSLSVSLGLFSQWAVGTERYSYINSKIGLLFY